MLSTQLYGNYTVQAINSLVVPILQQSAKLVGWTKEELYKLDVGAWKLMFASYLFYEQWHW